MKKITFLLCFIVCSLTLTAQSTFTTTSAQFGDVSGRQIGPALMSGRISCLASPAGQAELTYVGTAGGGVWKTTSSGADMRSVFDDQPQSIGAVAIDPTNPKTVWVGTGETWVRNSVGLGKGIFKSTNGGSVWKNMGLSQTERIADIVVHPLHPDTVYVAAMGQLWGANEERGVFKTTDGGKSWTKILYIDENTGAADLTIDPENPETLMASMWSFRRRPWTFDSGFNGNSGLYKTTNGGGEWRKIEKGIPAEKLGRIAVAIAPSSPDTVYASIETGSEDTKGFYRSIDGGESWTMTDQSFNTYVRPFYFSRITVDPSKAANVAKAGYFAIISEDGGESFRPLDQSAHPDVHDVWINPDNGKHIRIATDGGVYESFDRGEHLRMWQNLPVSQFYHVSVDMAKPYRIYGGLQDNGSWYAPSQSPGGITSADWRKSFGGDGFYSFRHPTKEHYIFSEYQGGNLIRYDERTHQSKAISPYPREGEEKLRWNWNSPLLLSQDGERLYFGAQYLYRSTDLGDNWERISPDLTTDNPEHQKQYLSGGLSIDNSTAENYTTIYAIAESPLDASTLWVGSDDGRIHFSADGGQNWTDVSPSLSDLPAAPWISFIEASPYDTETAYITLDYHRNGNTDTYLLKTTDGGKNWERLYDDNLDGHALSVRQDPVNESLLYLGTEHGLFVSFDDGKSWARFQNGVPPVAIRDMVIHPRESDLILGTHGRGVIIIDDLELLRQITPEVANGSLSFLTPPPAYLTSGGGGGAGDYSGSGHFRGPNPSRAVQIAWYAPKRHTFGKMFVEIFKDGKLIKEVSASRNAGLNIISIPTKLNQPKSAPARNRISLLGGLNGPNLEPGRYDVKLTKGKKTYSTFFDLQYDPESTYTDAEREAQRKAQMEVYHAQESLAYTYEMLNHIVSYETKAKLPKRTNEQLVNLQKTARKEQGKIVSLEGDGYVNETERLRDEIGNIYYTISTYAGQPSTDQLREVDRIKAAVADARERADAITATALQELNTRLEKAGAPPIKWPSMADFLAAEEKAGDQRGPQRSYLPLGTLR